MSLEASGIEQKVILGKTRHSKDNHTVKIFTQGYFSRILTKVNH